MSFSVSSLATRSPFVLGLGVALASAATFGSSGTFGASLMASGWSPGAVVAARISLGALLLLVPTVLSLRGRWAVLRANAPRVIVYGIVAVAGCQLAYFNAVDHLSVGVALLLEYLAPVLIVGWFWLRHAQRPSRLTVLGIGAAMLGLGLVLDVASGARIEVVGVLWGLLAALGLVVFFLISADGDTDLPPLALAGGGLVVGALSLIAAGAVGIMPLAMNTADVVIAGAHLPWWVSVVELGLVAAALAYVSGIIAAQMLGSTIASFVGLSEVLFAIVLAWVLVGEAMSPLQMLGGLAVLAGVVMVKLGSRDEGDEQPLPSDDVDTALVGDGGWFGDHAGVH